MVLCRRVDESYHAYCRGGYTASQDQMVDEIVSVDGERLVDILADNHKIHAVDDRVFVVSGRRVEAGSPAIAGCTDAVGSHYNRSIVIVVACSCCPNHGNHLGLAC